MTQHPSLSAQPAGLRPEQRGGLPADIADIEDRLRQLFRSNVRLSPERLSLLGRALFGGFFLYNGINHFANRAMMTAYAESKGVPAAKVAVAATGAMLVAGGASYLLGLKPKLGATLISMFLLGVTPKMHNFWAMDDEQQKMTEMINFSKNTALLGGALMSTAIPQPWPVSLGRR